MHLVTFKIYIWHYLEGVPPSWQHVQQTDAHSTAKLHLMTREGMLIVKQYTILNR